MATITYHGVLLFGHKKTVNRDPNKPQEIGIISPLWKVWRSLAASTIRRRP
jgi:hypothetical protein